MAAIQVIFARPLFIKTTRRRQSPGEYLEWQALKYLGMAEFAYAAIGVFGGLRLVRQGETVDGAQAIVGGSLLIGLGILTFMKHKYRWWLCIPALGCFYLAARAA